MDLESLTSRDQTGLVRFVTELRRLLPAKRFLRIDVAAQTSVVGYEESGYDVGPLGQGGGPRDPYGVRPARAVVLAGPDRFTQLTTSGTPDPPNSSISHEDRPRRGGIRIQLAAEESNSTRKPERWYAVIELPLAGSTQSESGTRHCAMAPCACGSTLVPFDYDCRSRSVTASTALLFGNSRLQTR